MGHPASRSPLFAKGLPANPMSKGKIVNLDHRFFAGKKVPVLTPAEAVVEEEDEKGEDES